MSKTPYIRNEGDSSEVNIKISLKNYLLKLDNNKYVRKGSDNIRLYGLGYIIKTIYVDIKKYKKIRELEEDRKRDHQTYSNWISDKTGISINELYELCKYWKKTCKKSNEDLKTIWERIYKGSNYFGCTNGKKIRLPKFIDYKLCYLIGVMLGDGHLADPNKSYDNKTSYNSEIRITDGYKGTFILLRQFFRDLFDYYPNIYSELSKTGRRFYRIVVRSKPIHRYLMTICNVPTGNKIDKVDIPKIIKILPLKLQKWFINGFFDSDGCARLAKSKYPEISISQKKVKILNSIIKFSKNVGVNWNGPYKTDSGRNHGYVIRISNIKHVEKFLNVFSSLNPMKIKDRGILWQEIEHLK